MKKAVLGFVLFFSANLLGYSQVTFNHSLGAAIYTAFGDAPPGSLAFMYSPRLNLAEVGDDITISVGTHLSLWFAGGSRTGTANAMVDAPLMAEINFGHASHPDSYADFGGFAGIGFGYSSISDGEASPITNTAVGPVGNIGARGYIAETSVMLRISYMLNLQTEGTNVFSIGLAYTFGDF